ncbi:MAG: hypothetical protein IT323_17930 [Anaerolineae bacterium]|nr:hypothetical protein [Anaerolineae bacterium]
MRRFVRRVALLALLMAALLFAVRLLGSAAQADAAPAALDPGACTQPCWRGLHVNATTVQEAAAQLRADPAISVTREDAYSVCWDALGGPFERGCAHSWRGIGAPNDKIQIMNLFTRGGQFRLGDAVRAFGPPYAYILPCREANGNVYFQGNIIAVMDTSYTRYGPESLVSYLSYVTTSAPWYAYEGAEWHGFDGRRAVRPCD